MTSSYGAHFRAEDEAVKYEAKEYAAESYPTLLWQIEQEQLRKIIQVLHQRTRRPRVLDFACGTGRITSFLEQYFDRIVGVDTSAAMLGIASRRVTQAQLVQGDLTSGGVLRDGQFDLITAFRFFANAEPALRASAVARLGSLLKDSSSLLVFNNHGNLLSHKLVAAPIHLAKRRGRRHESGNYMTHGQVVRLAEGAGLRIEGVLGYGMFSAKALALVGYRRLLAGEERLTGAPGLQRVGVNQLYTATRYP